MTHSHSFAARNRNAAGFTLVELLVVIAIIAVLAAVAVPAYAQYRRNAADSEMRVALQNARNAMEAFYEANDLTYESVTRLDLEAKGFPPDPDITLVILTATLSDYSLRACRAGGTAQSFKFDTSNGLIVAEDVPCS